MHLSRAPVRTAGAPLTRCHVIRSWTRRRRAGGIVVGDLLWPHGVTDIEDPYARVEVPTRKRRRMMPVVDAAVVAPVSEYPDVGCRDVRKRALAIHGIVRLQHQPGDDLGFSLVADVDDPRHREWRQSGVARSLVLRQEAESARTRLVDED